MSFDHLRATYFEECAELLESAYAQLAALAQGREDADTVHALFRAIHSIKGGGGAFGFGRLVGLAHAMETLLDLLRDGTIAFTPELVTLMLRGTDALADLLAAERDGAAAPPGLEAELTEAFLAAAAGTGAPASPAAAPPAAAAACDTGWRLRFRPHPAMFRNANEPLLLVRELRRLGPVTVAADASRLPPLERLEAEDAYIAWTFELTEPAPRDKVEEVFEFVIDNCELEIEPLAAESPVDLVPASPSDIVAPSGERPPPTRPPPCASMSRRSTAWSIWWASW